MVDRDTIKEMKKRGEIIITEDTFRKSVKFIQNKNHKTEYEYQGIKYTHHDFLLTYGHAQYQHLYNCQPHR